MLRPRPKLGDETGEVHKDFKHSTKRVDRLFGRLPDTVVMNMVKALKGD